jgi:hypothetical protein
MRQLCRLCVALVFAATLAAPQASAQSQATTGTIEGIVTDTTGAVLPGATVRLDQPAIGFSRDLVTDGQGRYRGLALPLGTYTITVELPGFSRPISRATPRRSARSSSARRSDCRRR